RYKEVGGQLSQLKYPTSGELTFAKGAAQTFQGGNIYWNKTRGQSYSVWGAIKSKYASINGSSSYLGLPRSNEMAGSQGAGQIFESGKIFWKSGKGAFTTHGAIGDLYNNLGSRGGKLGYPVSEEKKTADGKTYQDYEGGQIYWTKSRGAWVLYK
ncbi:MAG: hypothetical protein LBB10_01320, partial [Bifidobacteriaceae bacterium]|nr:hypothetical protein [Bifidobacteriaceae bacterium]